MGARGIVAVVGSRQLPSSFASHVSSVVGFFVERGWGIGSGGARGADTFALQAVLGMGPAACQRSLVCLPGRSTSALVRAFARQGGRFVAGSGSGRAALLARSRRLVQASAGVVAFLWGPSRGSVFTVRQAVRSGKPAAVVLVGGGAELPVFVGGRWEACMFGDVAAFRWVREPRVAEAERVECKRTALHRIFVVPDGEPVDALLTHVSGLTQGERLWFEQGVLAGDAVLVAHEALSDTPAWLGVPRLRRRFGCGAREAAGLAELFIGLDAGPDVVAWYEAEARRRGVAGVIEDLVYLVAQLAIAGAVLDGDALEEAERLGDYAEAVDGDGVVGQLPEQSGGEGAWLAWHALGSVQSEGVECPACRAIYFSDDEAAVLPVCPACGVADTWEAWQGAGFRELIGEIDGCSSLGELGVVGKRLYALALEHDQTGVAWSHFRMRKAALEAAVELGAPARALVARVERAPERELPRLGARLYQLQRRAAAAAIAAGEWRRIWQVYHARRRLCAA
jgi:hypothetical protein